MTLKDLMADKGMRPEDLSSKSRLSIDTVRRALRGEPLGLVSTYALSIALGKTEAEITEAIAAERAKGGV